MGVTCGKCGRVLRSAKSIEMGYGPDCLAKMKKATLPANTKPAQVDKALDLIRDRAILPIRRFRAFRCVSSNGQSRYLTAPEACNCPAGLAGRLCYHRVAATLLAA